MPHATLTLPTLSARSPNAAVPEVSRVRVRFLLLQSLITIVLSYQILFGVDDQISPQFQHLLILTLLLVAAGLMAAPARVILAPWFPATLVSCDTVLATTAIYFAGNASPELYLAYFLIMLVCASVPRLAHVLALSLILCLGYGLMLYLGIVQAGTISSGHLLGIPILLAMAAFYGATAETAQRQRRDNADLTVRVETLRQNEQSLRQSHDHLQEQIKALTEERTQIRIELQQHRVELARLMEQFHELPKMEAIGRTVRGITPELDRLTELVGVTTGMLLTTLPAEAPERRALQDLYDAGEQTAGLVHALRSLSRMDAPRSAIVSVNALVAGLEGIIKRMLGGTIETRLLLHPDSAVVHADPEQLEEALLTLVLQTRDALPRGGTVTVETGHVQLDEAFVVEHPGAKPGQYGLLTVRDTGRGLESDVRARAFEPFVAGTAKTTDAGLRLATVYGLIKQNAGYVDVSSRLGRGTGYQIYLPKVDESTACVEKPAGRQAGGTEAILLVEHDAIVQAIAAETLKRLGYTVLEAESAQEAVQIANSYIGTIHLLATSVRLPDMLGPELAIRLWQDGRTMKIMLLSGYSRDGVASEGVSSNAVLSKPFTPSAIARAVRLILDTR